MLTVTIPDAPDREYYNSEKNEFFTIKGVKGAKITLEHSLVSVRKWEMKHHKPFLKDEERTRQEELDYIRCMTLTQNVRDEVYEIIPPSVINQISQYIGDPMTATWFTEEKKKEKSTQTITAEIIYGWMIAFHIPSEYQKWHLNSLLALIRVCEIQQRPKEKKKKGLSREALFNRDALNEKRKAMYNTRG